MARKKPAETVAPEVVEAAPVASALDRYNLPPDLEAQARLYALAANPEAEADFVALRDKLAAPE